MIKKGDIVVLKKQFQDAGDEKFTWTAEEDEDGGRVLVSVDCLTLVKTEVIHTLMIESQ